jgi:hypothetical protein
MHGTAHSLRIGHRETTSGMRRWSSSAALRWRVIAALELIGRAAPLLGGRGTASTTRDGHWPDRAS